MPSKGFSPLIVILLVLFISLAGFFSYQSFWKAWQKGSTNTTTRQLSTPATGTSCSPPILEEIQQYSKDNIKISFRKNISSDMKQFVVDSFKSRPANIFKGKNEFAVTSSRIDGDWALLSISAEDGPCSDPYTRSLFCSGNIIAKRLSCQEWDMAIIGSDHYKELVKESPDTFLSPGAKTVFSQESNEHAAQE